MAHIGLRRLESQIRLVISEALQRKLNDPRLECMASVTRVELTADLSFVDVYISVMGTDNQQRSFMRGLDNAHGVLQRMIAKNLRTRTCPTLKLHLDQSIKKANEIFTLIDRSAAERAQREAESGVVEDAQQLDADAENENIDVEDV